MNRASPCQFHQFPRQVWNVAFAKFCELNGSHFDFQGCEFPPSAEKAGIAVRRMLPFGSLLAAVWNPGSSLDSFDH